MAFYSQYTGQRINPVPAGYLQANAQSALMMQQGLASIGESIGKYREKKEQEEQDEMLAEAAKMATAARDRNKSKKDKSKGKKLSKGKPTPSKKDAVTRTDISPKPVAARYKEPAPGPQGPLVPPARDEPRSPASRRAGMPTRAQMIQGSIPPAPQPDVQASMSAYSQPLPEGTKGPLAPPSSDAGYDYMPGMPPTIPLKSRQWLEANLDRPSWYNNAAGSTGGEPLAGPQEPFIPPARDLGQVGAPALPHGNIAPDAQRAYGMDMGIPAPDKPRAQGLDAGIPAPYAQGAYKTLNDSLMPVLPEMKRGTPAPEKGRATGVDIAEKKRRVTVNRQLASWLEKYGKDANADTIKSAYSIFDKAREDKRTERQDKRDRKNLRHTKKMQLERLEIERKRLALAQKEGAASTGLKKAQTEKTMAEVKILGKPVTEWEPGKAIQYELADGTKVPYAFVQVSPKGGGTVVKIGTGVPDKIKPEDHPRYAELFQKVLSGYHSALTPEDPTMGGPLEDFNPEEQDDSWKKTMDIQAQLILAIHKSLSESGFPIGPLPPMKSLMNPSKQLVAAPKIKTPEEKNKEDERNGKMSILGIGRPTR